MFGHNKVKFVALIINPNTSVMLEAKYIYEMQQKFQLYNKNLKIFATYVWLMQSAFDLKALTLPQ